ncbi:MAG: hypothetical protein ABFS05_04020 [Bacteroidota bacterium]
MAKTYLFLFYLTLPMLLLSQSPQKLIEKGEYDKAIEKCVSRLKKGTSKKTETYAALITAYEKANAGEQENIAKLKSSQMPEIWYDVFTSYYAMQQRYDLISVLADQLHEDQVNIQVVDYSEDLESARNNAVNYQYAYAESLLKTGVQDDALQAYIELLKITKLVSDYKDVELRMRQALAMGSKKALVEVKNKSKTSLSPDFLAEMENIALSHKQQQFLDCVSKADRGEQYPLLLLIEITSLEVSPGTVSEKEYTASHKNPESLEEAYKDETKKAEDKKNPDYNKCKIKEIYQIKSAVMKGRLKYVDGHSGTVLYVVPLTARSLFENRTATASGDMFACPPEVHDILDHPKKKFPGDADMIYELGKEFKILVKDIVWNEDFIK